MDGDGDPWHSIPLTSPGAKIAFAAGADAQGGATDPTALIRFGFRAKTDQAPGTYLAPLVFESIAPNS
jgi:hypothetical protein